MAQQGQIGRKISTQQIIPTTGFNPIAFGIQNGVIVKVDSIILRV